MYLYKVYKVYKGDNRQPYMLGRWAFFASPSQCKFVSIRYVWMKTKFTSLTPAKGCLLKARTNHSLAISSRHGLLNLR